VPRRRGKRGAAKPAACAKSNLVKKNCENSVVFVFGFPFLSWQRLRCVARAFQRATLSTFDHYPAACLVFCILLKIALSQIRHGGLCRAV
jgi:hypothetical protein